MDINWTDLIDKANEKYKSLKEEGTWKSKDPNKQQILALTSVIEKFADAVKTKNPRNRDRDKKPAATDNDKSDKAKKHGYADWRVVQPADGDPHE